MKLIALLMVIFTFTACEKSASPKQENFLQVGRCASFSTSGTTISYCLDSVLSDSRCPVNAVCAWQGVGIIRVSIKTQTTPKLITLATSDTAGYTTSNTVDGFNIELKELIPVPTAGTAINYNDYQAKLSVTRQ